MKNRIVKVIGMATVCSMFALPVFAVDVVPIGAGMDSKAFLCLIPLTNPNLGSETIIYYGTSYDIKTEVSEIPIATWNNETKQMRGTYLLLNWNQEWDDANNPESENFEIYVPGAWCYYYFALNGSEVTVTNYTKNGSTLSVDIIDECILFKVERTEDGKGNSNYDAGRNFDIEILGYK